MKAKKAIEKLKGNLKCVQKQSGAECDRKAVKRKDSNASIRRKKSAKNGAAADGKLGDQYI